MDGIVIVDSDPGRRLMFAFAESNDHTTETRRRDIAADPRPDREMVRTRRGTVAVEPDHVPCDRPGPPGRVACAPRRPRTGPSRLLMEAVSPRGPPEPTSFTSSREPFPYVTRLRRPASDEVEKGVRNAYCREGDRSGGVDGSRSCRIHG